MKPPTTRLVILRTGCIAQAFSVPAEWTGNALDAQRTLCAVASRDRSASVFEHVAFYQPGDDWYTSRNQRTGAVIGCSAELLASIAEAEDLGEPVGLLRYDLVDATGRNAASYPHDAEAAALDRIANPRSHDRAPLTMRPYVCAVTA